MTSQKILIGKNGAGTEVNLLSNMLNRHGLIAGATGTGKTVSLQILAESFAKLGIPVFAADIKGDLSGIAKAATESDKLKQRVERLKLSNYKSEQSLVTFWDVYGKQGLPLRTTISEVGPILLSHLLNCTDAQAGTLHIAFKIADEQGLLLLDLKDLKSLLQWIDENKENVSNQYGRVNSASISALQREILILENAGGDAFFGEPAIELNHIMQRDFSGRGVVSLLDATNLINNPRIYCTFLLWLLSELFEQLEEVGDQALPKLVFFFDEAHLLFSSASNALLERIEQLVRLIRSKGVGVFFITQHPQDIPDRVAAQLSTRVQHALRAFTPKEQDSLKTAAKSFRQNPNIDSVSVLTTLAVGEALVSTLDEQGVPQIVEHTIICPPQSQIGPVSSGERQEFIARSPLKGNYEKTIDRESAHEMLNKRKADGTYSPEKVKVGSNRQGAGEAFFKSVIRSIGSALGGYIIGSILGSRRGGRRRSSSSGVLSSIGRSVGSSAGRQIMRGVLGNILK